MTTGAASEELGGHTVRIYAHIALVMLRELTLLAFWFATLVLMCLPKGKDYRNMFVRPPYLAWHFAVLCAVIEM